MTQIERRQARIRRIRQKIATSGAATPITTDSTFSSTAHYHVGKTQNNPVDIMPFIYKYSTDPAVKVSII